MPNYIRVATLCIDEVIPFVFTKKVRALLKKAGASYTSVQWISKCKKEFGVVVEGKKKTISVAMGSHRYQLFAEKGVTCAECGIAGTYFAIEKDLSGSTNKYHLNLYGVKADGKEVMLTKDHIVPRSKGGKNLMSNYQTLCFDCNNRKSDNDSSLL